ncbi:MAG: hypothetical protein DUD39_17700 [Coriobacteriaceae bacterium]|nr:MAG: hypothetical protein DUD39_17700 [Coriobacteriaceae bacterium]
MNESVYDLYMGLRKAVERSFDICLDIRDDPVGLRGSEASSYELSYFFWTSSQKQSSPTDIPLPGIGTDLGHMTEVVVFELPPGITRAVIHAAQDAATLSSAVSIGCCFVPHPLVPFDLASM